MDDKMLKAIDYLMILLIGELTAIITYYALGPDWGMFSAMFAGMGIGMVVLVLFFPVIGYFSSFFHFMPPAMIVVMPGGMFAGMAVANSFRLHAVMLIMLFLSLFSQFLIDLYNMKLKGEVKFDN